jgi:hypothetical protein
MSASYHANPVETPAALEAIVAAAARPVLLVEGIRDLPESDWDLVVRMGRMLAQRFPTAVFRSGNARGTDTAFAEGVALAAPNRLEYVITHAAMGRARRRTGARAFALDGIPNAADTPVGDYTVAASPGVKGLVDAYRARGGASPLGAKAAYLLRDTLKVVGAPELELPPATAGIFYVSEADPLSGGTGHTVRVCLQRRVPVVFQRTWRGWIR